MPLKGFKEYKMYIDQASPTSILPEKKIPNRLKPLKFHEYKKRGVTEKKIKGPIEMFFDNQSTIGFSDREKSRTTWMKNEVISRRMKDVKNDELIKEMFPSIREEECLLLRIQEINVQGSKE